MLELYKSLSNAAEPLFRALLVRRARNGKEIDARLLERQGQPVLARPSSPLVWVHAASVGEAQSALILIDRLLKQNQALHILMTTGTVSSAAMMEKNLPARAIHQFYPLDHPRWVESFLNHWSPDAVFWMESELWPNMLLALKQRGIPAVLVNARLSQRSYRRWSLAKSSIREILGAFSLILTQSEKEAGRYRALGATNVQSTGNLKYSAKPLACDEEELKSLTGAIGVRPMWVYASTHKGEESLACNIHQKLKMTFPELLTILVPRHPNRRADIAATCRDHYLNTAFRGERKTPPTFDTEIYIADTFGELGLFYRLAPIACIGRSFSDDGGGGHNPIEAAQLNCAVLYGPHVQFQKELYEEMSDAHAAVGLKSEAELTNKLRELLENREKREALQQKGAVFTQTKSKVIDTVMDALAPYLDFSPEKMRAAQ